MSDPIPGWYPDPEEPSRQRFWDGTQWTEARAYPMAAGPDGAPVVEAAPSGSRNVNGKVLALVIAVAVLAAILVWFLFLRGGSSTPEPLPTPSQIPVSPSGVPSASASKVPTAPPPATPTVPATPSAAPSP